MPEFSAVQCRTAQRLFSLKLSNQLYSTVQNSTSTGGMKMVVPFFSFSFSILYPSFPFYSSPPMSLGYSLFADPNPLCGKSANTERWNVPSTLHFVEVECERYSDTSIASSVLLLYGQRRDSVMQPGGHEDHGPLFGIYFQVVAHIYIQTLDRSDPWIGYM